MFWRKVGHIILGLREGQENQNTLECSQEAWQYDCFVCLVLVFLFCFGFVLFLPRWAAGNSRPSASSTLYGPAMAASCSQ